MSQSRLSKRQRTWLKSELDSWESEGIVTQEQASRVLACYESSEDYIRHQHSMAMLTITGVAALLMGLGVLLLVGYNWEDLGDLQKVSILVGGWAGIQGVGLAARFKLQARWPSEVLFFLGALVFGSGIFLIAQIFNINAHYPDGVWLWAFGVTFFALASKNLLLHCLNSVLLALWCGMEIGGGEAIVGWSRGWLDLPPGAYTLPLLATPGLIWSYGRGSQIGTALYVFVLGLWAWLQAFVWEWEWAAIYWTGMVGLILLLIGESHQKYRDFGIIYRVYGAVVVGVVLQILSFASFNEEAVEYRDEIWPLASLVIALLFILILALAGTSLKISWEIPDRSNRLREFMRSLIPLRPVLLLITLFALLVGWDLVIGEPVFLTLTANIACLILAIWLISVGLREDRGRPFWAGICYFLLWIFLRYIDLFGDFGGMLGGALMFFICGLSLLFVALYWNMRAKVKHD
jgi:hypothetical protein